MTKKLSLVGYAFGLAAGNPQCADGPEAFQRSCASQALATNRQDDRFGRTQCGQSPRDRSPESQFFDTHWTMLKSHHPEANVLEQVIHLNTRLAEQTYSLTKQHQPFAVIGGDHSSAIGTWSGVSAAVAEQGDFGLVWLDAHMDANTDETSPSGNVHGMPVAVLLGRGNPALTSILGNAPKLKPEHISLIGIRSFEEGEKNLLESLGVRIYYIEEVKMRGFSVVFDEAIQRAKTGTAAYGISVDLDGLDPSFAPGVGTPEENGFTLEELCASLKKYAQDKQWIGLEIAEFNPHLCHDGRTEQAIATMLENAFG